MTSPATSGPVEESRAAAESAVLLDSPHSGSRYPADFGHACERGLLRSTEDARIDEMFGFAPALGATFVKAHFPRSYIDANRPHDDIDPLLLGEAPAAGQAGSAKSRLGMGLVWRLVDGRPIYARRLTHEEIQARIATCWQPYQDTVLTAWRRITEAHGFGIHLNCHSMPSTSSHYPPSLGATMPFDFIIGTRDGTTAAAGLANFVVGLLRRQGWRVALNEVFKGVELIRQTGDPPRSRHALQIEINKRIYLDERTLEAHAGFASVQAHMRELVQALVGMTDGDIRALG